MFPKYTKIAPITLAALIINMAFALNAHAQYSQIYAEISYGQTELDSFEQFPSYSDFEEQSGNDDAIGFSVGRHFNDNLAVEIGYFDFGSFQSEVTALFPRLQYGDDELFVGFVPSVPDFSQIKISLVQISLIGSFDLGQRFSFFVKGGISQGFVRAKIVDNNLLILNNPLIPDTVSSTSSASESGSGLYLGAGMLVNFTRTFSMKIEYQSYNISNSLFSENLGLQATTLGLRYKF